VLQNSNINTETHMSIIKLSEMITVTAELGQEKLNRLSYF